METWEKPISSARYHHRHPSFSSTLLDQIYLSIDDSPTLESTRKKKKQHRHNTTLHEDRETSPDYHRRSIATDFERYSKTTTTDSVFLRSSSGSRRSKFATSPPPQKPNSKKELGGFLRTKTKALKIYTDLKKVKQPISPGGKLATFLNSLFTTTNAKKQKKIITSVVEPQYSSTCSSASSFSRSCLSKTPSSSGKSKMSVRFCPLDEHSSIHMPYSYNNDAKRDRHANRCVIEAAKDLLRNYKKNNVEEEEEDDEDAASYASSDLFELENLSAIGIERYGQELPVYETTRLDMNRAIATTDFIV